SSFRKPSYQKAGPERYSRRFSASASGTIRRARLVENESKHDQSRNMARIRLLFQLALLIAASAWPAIARTQQANTRQETEAPAGQALPLSPEAAQVANEIDITFLIEKLRIEHNVGSAMSLETLAVRQEITEKVLAASLDVD